MPKFTVVMAAKNSSATIGQAIRSVLSGLPADSEVVVWDDGSEDGTGDAALRAAGGRTVRVIRSEVSVGSGRARQNIIDGTDSEFIINMDSDDVSMPWRFHFQLPEMERTDFCFSSSFRFAGRNVLLKPTLPLGYNDSDTHLSLAFHNGLTHSSMIARRTALSHVGGYGDLVVAQDYELWLRAAANGARFRRLGVPCLAYRISERQISNQDGYVKKILEQPEVFRSYLDLLETLTAGQSDKLDREATISENLEVVAGLLPSLVDGFRKHLRPSYTAILRRTPSGPFQGLAHIGVD